MRLPILSGRWRTVLASAYEVSEERVLEDATLLQQWDGSDADLLHLLEQRHRWTSASENGRYYLAALRVALA